VTEDDIRVLLDGYEAWNRGEFDVLAEVLDPEMEWEPGFGDLNAGVHHGADGFRGFVDSWLESFDDFSIRPELLVQAGDTVVVVAHQHGRGQGSGIELDTRVVHVWTVKQGKALRWWGPRTLDDALEVIGDEKPAVALRSYEAFNRGDLEEALSVFDPEIVWHTYLVPGPGGGTYHGHEGVRELWADARNIFGDFRNEPERLIAAEDRLVVLVRVCGWGKESGVEVEAKIAHIHTFRGGRIVRVDSYEDREEALRELGETPTG
jgi:ketosteroid isomerase-like protein